MNMSRFDWLAKFFSFGARHRARRTQATVKAVKGRWVYRGTLFVEAHTRSEARAELKRRLKRRLEPGAEIVELLKPVRSVA